MITLSSEKMEYEWNLILPVISLLIVSVIRSWTMSTSQGHFHEADDQELTHGVERNRKETLELGDYHQKIRSTNLLCNFLSCSGHHVYTCSHPCYGAQGVIKNKTEFLLFAFRPHNLNYHIYMDLMHFFLFRRYFDPAPKT